MQIFFFIFYRSEKLEELTDPHQPTIQQTIITILIVRKPKTPTERDAVIAGIDYIYVWC